jgi:hypothetical protein
VDTFASITLGNCPDQFKDLKMHDDMEVEGIQGGLDIKGTGTLSFISRMTKEGCISSKSPTASTYLI